MKKFKTFLFTALAMMMTLVCFASCALLQRGKYTAVSYKIGPLSVDVSGEEEEGSYVELKGDDVAVVCIKIATITWEGEGTWAADDEGKDKTVDITIGGITYEAVIDGSTMTLDVGIGSIVLEK